VPYIFGVTNTDDHLQEIAEIVAPQGRFGLIDNPMKLDMQLFKAKAVSVHWESMFTRSLYQTPDMIKQHQLLNEVSALVDAGLLRSTLTEEAGSINAANLKRVHALLESGRNIGKTVLSGF